MASSVGAATDQCLVEGTTYIYRRMQTQILQVTVGSGTPISVLQTEEQVLHRCYEFYSYRLRGVCTQHVTTIMKLDHSGDLHF